MSSEIWHAESLNHNIIFAVFIKMLLFSKYVVLGKKNPNNRTAQNHIAKQTSIYFCTPIALRKNNELVIFKVTFSLWLIKFKNYCPRIIFMTKSSSKNQWFMKTILTQCQTA